MTIIGVYALEEGFQGKTEEFYDQLQNCLNTSNRNDYIVIAGDLNGRIGKTPVQNIMEPHVEPTVNLNGKILIDFASYNDLKITNSFYRHKDIHKYTWSARGSRSIIDYTVVNRKLSNLIHDTRVYRGKDIGSDDYPLITKIAIPARWKRDNSNKQTERQTFKVHLLKEESIRQLYNNRLDNVLSDTPVNSNINREWDNIKECIYKAASEAPGKRTKKYNKRCLKIWNDDLDKVIFEKKQAYLQQLNIPTPGNIIELKGKAAIPRREVRKVKRESWQNYIHDIENDLYSRQEKAYFGHKSHCNVVSAKKYVYR